MDKLTIAVDVMGGDYAPLETVKGCVEAAEMNSALKLLLVGREAEIRAELAKYPANGSNISVVNASEVITNDESPTAAIRKKKDSSIVVGLSMLKSGEAGAFVSAGSTGALLTGALLLAGRIKGVDRPALATLLPNKTGKALLIDSGANVDCKPEFLRQFAIMGSLYMEHIQRIAAPRVGLANIGAEREKGNALTKEAYELLENTGLNFVGNIEARDIPLGAADVVVCDGFTGNIILKYTEGFAKAMLSIIKQELMSGLITKIGAALAGSAFRRLKPRFDASEVGGAAFLGLNGLVVKAHGSSDAKAMRNAVFQCQKFLENDIAAKIADKLR